MDISTLFHHTPHIKEERTYMTVPIVSGLSLLRNAARISPSGILCSYQSVYALRCCPQGRRLAGLGVVLLDGRREGAETEVAGVGVGMTGVAEAGVGVGIRIGVGIGVVAVVAAGAGVAVVAVEVGMLAVAADFPGIACSFAKTSSEGSISGAFCSRNLLFSSSISKSFRYTINPEYTSFAASTK